MSFISSFIGLQYRLYQYGSIVVNMQLVTFIANRKVQPVMLHASMRTVSCLLIYVI